MGKSGNSRRSVLLVEDECLVLTELASEMERAGWAVIEASSGEGAINHLRNGEQIDLLVTDIQLAGYLTGWDVAETARKTRPELPVVYTSGNVLNRARKVAGSVFLSKPCQPSEVANVGDKLVERTRSRNGQT